MSSSDIKPHPSPSKPYQDSLSHPSQTRTGPDQDHPYNRRLLGCPCPAIATMINHNYLKPTDSSDRIPWYRLVWALITCYNLTLPFALIFVLVANLRLKTPLGFNIDQLSKHGVIEHDASITRYNISDGDNLNPQNELIDFFLNSPHYPKYLNESKKMITLQDYAKRKVVLEKEIKSYPINQSPRHVRLLGVGESALALQAFEDREVALVGDGGIHARAEWLNVWYREERFPVELGWKMKSPFRKISIFSVIKNSFKIIQAKKRLM